MEENGPVFVTKNGYGRFVVMDIEYYEKTIGKILEAKTINEGLDDLVNGIVVDDNAVKTKMKRKYGL